MRASEIITEGKQKQVSHYWMIFTAGESGPLPLPQTTDDHNQSAEASVTFTASTEILLTPHSFKETLIFWTLRLRGLEMFDNVEQHFTCVKTFLQSNLWKYMYNAIFLCQIILIKNLYILDASFQQETTDVHHLIDHSVNKTRPYEKSAPILIYPQNLADSIVKLL